MLICACGHKNPDTYSVVSAIVFGEIEGAEARVSGELNKETKYVLERFGFEIPKIIEAGKKKVFLVDHNSPDEMAEEIVAEEIVGIVDHHKLSGPFTPEPIEVFMKPYGSTATIVALLAESHKKTLSKPMASLLLCGIISDTLHFTSPTTTEKDKEVAQTLNKVASLDLRALAAEMFRAKSDISDIKTEDLITKDMKNFNFSGKKVGVGVWETTNPGSILERKSEIHRALREKKKKEDIEHIFFAAIDIVEGAAHFIVDTNPEMAILEGAFELAVKEGVLRADGIVSRKKQIVPAFEKYFSKGV